MWTPDYHIYMLFFFECRNITNFPSLNPRGLNLFQHDGVSMKTWFSLVGMEELGWKCPAHGPDLKPTEHLRDELEHRLHYIPDLANALVDK